MDDECAAGRVSCAAKLHSSGICGVWRRLVCSPVLRSVVRSGNQAILTPIFAACVYLGQHLFRIAPTDWFKKVTYVILIGIALIMMAS